jgi:putative nucleotidyltransferase with HDIG domain
LSHLFLRFFDVLFSRTLTADERGTVLGWLRPAEEEIFFAQGRADQRHGYNAASSVVASEIDDLSTVRAALLHDVGKRHARLGPIGRSIASILIGFDVPLTRRMVAYRDHGPVAAEELDDLGCEEIVVAFARNHHGERPNSLAQETWDILLKADGPAKAITSAEG